MKGTAEGKMTVKVLMDQMQRTGLIPVFNHSDSEVAKNVLDASYKEGFVYLNLPIVAKMHWRYLAYWLRMPNDMMTSV